MMRHRRALGLLAFRQQRLLLRDKCYNTATSAKNKRFASSSKLSPENNSNNNQNQKTDHPEEMQKNIKWTEREQAPAWMQRISPTMGGRELPTPKEFAVISVVLAAFYYSWFVDPPKNNNNDKD